MPLPQTVKLGRRACRWSSRRTLVKRRRVREERREKRAACLLSTEKEARLRVPPPASLTALNLVALLGGGGVPHGRTGASKRGRAAPSVQREGRESRVACREALRLAWRGPAPSLPSPPLRSALGFPRYSLPLPPLCSAPSLWKWGRGRSDRRPEERGGGGSESAWLVCPLAAVPPSLPPQLTHDGNDGLRSAASFFGVGVLNSVPDARKKKPSGAPRPGLLKGCVSPQESF